MVKYPSETEPSVSAIRTAKLGRFWESCVSDGEVTFTDIEFEQHRRRWLTAGTAVVVIGWGLTATLLAYDVLVVSPEAPFGANYTRPGRLAFGWDPTQMDWLTMFSATVAVAASVPWLRRPEQLRAAVAAYPDGLVARGALAVCLLTLAAGVFGPFVVPEPIVDFQGTDQPPLGFSIQSAVVGECVGPVTDGQCAGSLAHPLGTTRGGIDVLAWILYGTRTVIQFTLVAATLMAPIGVAAGLAAGYLGGRTDTLVTGYIDIQQTVPTIIIYFLVTTLVGPNLFTLVVVYGLFDWGGIARLVRSKTIEERAESYVEAAEAAGAGSLSVVRSHLLPNVAPTALTAVSLQLPKLVLVEIGLSFISLGGEGTFSWGQLLQRGLRFELGGGFPPYSIGGNLRTFWWVSIVPALVALLVVLAASLTGDAIQRGLDPRE